MYKGTKPYNKEGKPNYKKGPKADLYKGFRKDVSRGNIPPTKEDKQRVGRMANDKLYQGPNERYTNGQMPDTKTPPPKKPKQIYGKLAKGVTVTPGNKNFKSKKGKGGPSAAGTTFAKTNKMPKAKPITSIAQIRAAQKAAGETKK